MDAQRVNAHSHCSMWNVSQANWHSITGLSLHQLKEAEGICLVNMFLKVCDRDVTYERLDGEVIAVNLMTGRYYSMSGTAADCWTALTAAGSVSGARALIEAIYGQVTDLEQALHGFLSTCLEAGLIETTTSTNRPVSTPGLPDDFDRDRWMPPRLEEYEDLQDLILVDPVHDTSALGWPHVDNDDT
jgi:hypothetical protein